MINPSDFLPCSSTLIRYNNYRFREEVAFAIEGLPFYKPIINEYGYLLANTDYEYILDLPGDSRIRKFISSQGNVIEVPLVKMARYFEYFEPFLEDRWTGDEEVVTDFSDKELIYIRNVDCGSVNYESAKRVYAFFCAKPFVYINLIYPADYYSKDKFDKFGSIVKEVYNFDVDMVNEYFPSFDKIPDALYYFLFGITNDIKHIHSLAANYCYKRKYHKDAIAHMYIAYHRGDKRKRNLPIKLLDVFIEEIRETIHGVRGVELEIAKEALEAIDPIDIIKVISEYDYECDLKCIAMLVILYNTSPLFGWLSLFNNLFYAIPYHSDKEVDTEHIALCSICSISSGNLRIIHKAIKTYSTREQVSQNQAKVGEQICKVIKTVDKARRSMHDVQHI